MAVYCFVIPESVGRQIYYVMARSRKEAVSIARGYNSSATESDIKRTIDYPTVICSKFDDVCWK